MDSYFGLKRHDPAGPDATIAVLIVSGTMIAVYSDQSVREGVTIEDYSASLQNEILEDIALDCDFRFNGIICVRKSYSFMI